MTVRSSVGAGAAITRYVLPGVLVLVLASLLLIHQLTRTEIRLESEPTGARVRLDGEFRGVTPITVAMAPGRHRIEVEHSHYSPQVFRLEARRGDRLERRIELQPGLGTLSLLSNPRGAWVELDGQRLTGVTPMRTQARSGPTQIRMGLAERRVVDKSVIVLTGQEIEVKLALENDPHGSLTVEATPGDAEIRFMDLDLTYEPGVRVPVGEHLIEVTRPGYEARRIRYTVRRGDNTTSVALGRELAEMRIRTRPADASVTLSYAIEAGREAVVPYTPGVRVPTGRVEIRARALGHRTGYRAMALGPEGANVDLTLEAMDFVAGNRFRDRLAGGGTGPEMTVLPPGSFVMGDADGAQGEQPAAARTLTQAFAVSVHEITAAEFLDFARATGHEIDTRLTASREPARYLSWQEANAYADWLTAETGARYRLPTEAEWEYAARAGTDADYWFGDDVETICSYANLADMSTRRIYRGWVVTPCDDGFATLAPVGSFAANGFGLHDVHGNVAEWVQECGMPAYDDADEDGSLVNSGQNCRTHGVRGGSWDGPPEALRSARRSFASGRGDDRGMRLVKEL